MDQVIKHEWFKLKQQGKHAHMSPAKSKSMSPGKQARGSIKSIALVDGAMQAV